MGRTWLYKKNCKNKCDENNNINNTKLNAVKILLQADHGYLVIINEIYHNRNTMSSSYHFLAHKKPTFSSLLESIWGYVTEFWPIEGNYTTGLGSENCLLDPTYSVFPHWPAGWGNAAGNSREALGHRQNHRREGFWIPESPLEGERPRWATNYRY